MFDRNKEAVRRVVGMSIMLRKHSAKRTDDTTSRHRIHAVLDLIEEFLMIATSAVVLALALAFGNMPGQQHATLARNLTMRPTLASRLLSDASNGASDVAYADSESTRPPSVLPRGGASPQQGLSCSGRTIMNIVAHQDDDLLFINPDIIHDIQRHDCVRTVYVTAGDDGRGTQYLLSREAGSEAAYDVMLGNTKPWQYQSLTLSSGATVTAANPKNDTNISLIFLRLPDGNLDGSGFANTGYESIAKLLSGPTTRIASVDSYESYTSAQLTTTLAALMERYMPTRINTQANDTGLGVADHSDHIATGEYTTLAAALYAQREHLVDAGLVQYFMGYPTRAMSSNLSLADTALKAAVFFAYAVHDPGVCTSMDQCMNTGSSYGLYLSRQYTFDQ